MVDLTILEVHLDGSEFTANAPFSSGGEDDSVDVEEGSDPDSGRGKLLAVLIGLAFCVAVAYLARNRLGGEDEIEAVET
jgi:hypothetical protein